jgi:hypothetical protein
VIETPLEGGDLNAVTRVGDTVRRPTGPWSPAVHALLRHFEAVGFDGAPRVLGVDDEDREVLTYVLGDAALAPVPAGEDTVFEIGVLLRQVHDAQTGFEPPLDARWQRLVGAPDAGEVVCHNDLFWPNVIVRDGRVAALVDWDLAAPAPRLHDLANAANFWVALRDDSSAAAWGVPCDRRGERLSALLDGYGLELASRPALLDAVEARNRIGLATYRRWGRDERRPGWAELWQRDQDRYLVRKQRWLDAHRGEVESWLR